MQRTIPRLLLTIALGLAASQSLADSKTDARLENARLVFTQFADLSEQQIPAWLLDRAYGIAVVPDVIKGALIVGGRGGRGVLAVRNPDGGWSHPVFVTLAGVNVGFQWGVQSSDVILVFMSRQSVEGISGGKVTLGADAAVAAGPLGRSAAASTDASLKAQVLSYSRSEGLFAGVALDGSVLSIDDSANASAYSWSDVLPSQILAGEASQVPQQALEFVATLNEATSRASSVAAPSPAAAGPAAAVAVPAPTAPAPAVPADGAQTFPLEDPNPGAPPPQ